jgi:hypothetical protein
MKNPTFQEFVDDAFMAVFNALIMGGTGSMKAQLKFFIGQAARIAESGGFAETE